MKAKATKIDSATRLVKDYDGNKLGIIWAGCFYGPVDSIEQVATDDLLSQCLSLLSDSATVWVDITMHDNDNGLGLIALDSLSSDSSTL